MPNYTTNLNLEQPLDEEQYDVAVTRRNNQKIDNFAGQVPARALTADTLTTARKINGVDFKGNADIQLPIVNADNDSIKVNDGIISVNPDFIYGGSAFINNSKAMETGLTSNNDVVYNNVYKYNHSTFDVTKFTVTGTPDISDNGIASKFSASNYLSIPSVTLNATSDIKIYARFNMQTATNNFVWLMGNYAQYPALMVNATSITYFYGGAEANHIKKTGLTIELNTDYDVLVHYNFGTINLYYKPASSAEYELLGTATVANDYSYSSVVYIGAPSGNQSWFFHGAIDLKYFEITLNDFSLFTSHQTGIDTIKSNDYTATGSPVANDYGIASGFSASNYINTPSVTLNAVDDIKIYTRFTLTGTSTQNTLWCMGNYQSSPTLMANATSIRIFLGGSESNNIVGSGLTINLNTPYDVLVHYNKGTVSLYYKLATAENYTALGSKTIEDAEYSYSYPLIVGKTTTNNDWYLHGTLDLNLLRVYTNGDLTYQACLKIPYTKSKTGSKIADVLSRESIKVLYEKDGFAPYYTIDEANQNFTLPMGEIYGMIQKVLNSMTTAFMPDYDNGIAVTINTDYTVPDNGWAMVRGLNAGSTFTINGVIFLYCHLNEASSDSNDAIFPVRKGDVIKMTAGSLAYYPCKGVN